MDSGIEKTNASCLPDFISVRLLRACNIIIFTGSPHKEVMICKLFNQNNLFFPQNTNEQSMDLFQGLVWKTLLQRHVCFNQEEESQLIILALSFWQPMHQLVQDRSRVSRPGNQNQRGNPKNQSTKQGNMKPIASQSSIQDQKQVKEAEGTAGTLMKHPRLY